MNVQDLDLLRFHTSTSGTELVSMKEYVDHKPEEQSDIYYATGESLTAISKSPFSEFLCKKGIEVLNLENPVEKYAALKLKEVYGENLKPILREGIKTECLDRAGMAVLLRFHTSKSGAELTSLKEYVDRARKGQNAIYYITAAKLPERRAFLEEAQVEWPQFYDFFQEAEVLHLADPVDEYAVQQLKKFNNMELKSAI